MRNQPRSRQTAISKRPPDGTRDLEVEYREIASLNLCARNPRTHSRKQIRQIADSISEFGFTNPVLIDDDGRIIAGHGRIEAAKLLGIETVPTIRLEDMTEAQTRLNLGRQ